MALFEVREGNLESCLLGFPTPATNHPQTVVPPQGVAEHGFENHHSIPGDKETDRKLRLRKVQRFA